MITKEKFNTYLEVQKSGEYNMITDCAKVMEITGLNTIEYFEIIKDYRKLYEKFIKE